MNKFVFGALIAAVFIILFMLVGKTDIGTVIEEASDAPSSQEDSIFVNESVRWNFHKERGGSAFGTAISLEMNGRNYEAGAYTGECLEKRNYFLPGEIPPYVLCWEGDIATEIGVFKEGDKYILKKGIWEKGEDEAHPAFRGNFNILLEL